MADTYSPETIFHSGERFSLGPGAFVSFVGVSATVALVCGFGRAFVAGEGNDADSEGAGYTPLAPVEGPKLQTDSLIPGKYHLKVGNTATITASNPEASVLVFTSGKVPQRVTVQQIFTDKTRPLDTAHAPIASVAWSNERCLTTSGVLRAKNGDMGPVWDNLTRSVSSGTQTIGKTGEISLSQIEGPRRTNATIATQVVDNLPAFLYCQNSTGSFPELVWENGQLVLGSNTKSVGLNIVGENRLRIITGESTLSISPIEDPRTGILGYSTTAKSVSLAFPGVSAGSPVTATPENHGAFLADLLSGNNALGQSQIEGPKAELGAIRAYLLKTWQGNKAQVARAIEQANDRGHPIIPEEVRPDYSVAVVIGLGCLLVAVITLRVFRRSLSGYNRRLTEQAFNRESRIRDVLSL